MVNVFNTCIYHLLGKMIGFVKAADILGGKIEDGAEVKLRGWIYTSRSSGGIQFLEIRDGSGVIQCTLSKRNIDEGCCRGSLL